jgi:hypothetical protein
VRRVSRRFLALTTLAVVGATALASTQTPPAPQPAPRPTSPARAQPPILTARSEPGRFTTLPNFAVERAVPAGKTDSYVAMTFDSQGRLVVSKELDHPRRLVDADNDGVFEGEVVVSTRVKNCQGLWYDGPTLYGSCNPAVAEGQPAPAEKSGLYQMPDADGDGVTEGATLIAPFIDAVQEHGVHALRRGPDGALTMMTGNNTFFVDEGQIDPASPFAGGRESQFLPVVQDGRGFGPSAKIGAHGTVHRVDPATKRFTIIAGAFRNAYDHAFNLAGELFTFDSDMEWDIGMPWYRDIRTVHVVPGGDYGYRNGSGKLPAWAFDSLPPVRDVGRGSPVGVEFYQATAYPASMRDALLEADWSRGRLLYTPLTRKGASYVAAGARTELVHGEPLNITDVEVGPDGLVYFTTGGRSTEGGVWRITYGGPRPAMAKLTPLLAAVRQPQPLSSWGHAAVAQAKAALGDGWASGLEALARDRSAKGDDRAQAVYVLQRHGPVPSVALLTDLMREADADVRAAAVFAAGVQGPKAAAAAAAGLKDLDPLVQRRAAEALVRMGQSPGADSLAPAADIYALLGSPDRFVRFAGRLALQRTARSAWRDRVLAETHTVRALDAMVAYVFTAPDRADLLPLVDRQIAWMGRSDLSIDLQLRLLRAFQLTAIEAARLTQPAPPANVRRDGQAGFQAQTITAGDIDAARLQQVHQKLIGRFPSTDERIGEDPRRHPARRHQPGPADPPAPHAARHHGRLAGGAEGIADGRLRARRAVARRGQLPRLHQPALRGHRCRLLGRGQADGLRQGAAVRAAERGGAGRRQRIGGAGADRQPGHRAQPRHPGDQPRRDVRRADLHAAPDARAAGPGPGALRAGVRAVPSLRRRRHRLRARPDDAGVALQEARRGRGHPVAVAGGLGSVPERRSRDHRQADALRPDRARGRRHDRPPDDAGRAAARNRQVEDRLAQAVTRVVDARRPCGRPQPVAVVRSARLPLEPAAAVAGATRSRWRTD